MLYCLWLIQYKTIQLFILESQGRLEKWILFDGITDSQYPDRSTYFMNKWI